MATDDRAGFNPKRTRTDKTKLAAWLMAKVEGDLNEVPGIGSTTKGVLIEAGITTTYQLFGAFLSLKGQDCTGSVDLCDRFWYFLEKLGTPAGYRSTIVQAVACKLDTSFPGLYNSAMFPVD